METQGAKIPIRMDKDTNPQQLPCPNSKATGDREHRSQAKHHYNAEPSSKYLMQLMGCRLRLDSTGLERLLASGSLLKGTRAMMNE